MEKLAFNEYQEMFIVHHPLVWRVSEWLFFNDNSAIFQPYHGKFGLKSWRGQ